MKIPELLQDLGTRLKYGAPLKYALWKCPEINCLNTFEASYHDVNKRRKRNCGCRMNLEALPAQINNITVITDLGTTNNRRKALFECPLCRSTYSADVSQMKRNSAMKHCGCHVKPKAIKQAYIPKVKIVKPRQSKHRLFSTWKGMINRCHYEKDNSYHNYGGRAIYVCDRWRHSFPNFVEDMIDKPTDKHTLDRKDNNLGYSKDNCKWSTMSEQAANKRIKM